MPDERTPELEPEADDERAIAMAAVLSEPVRRALYEHVAGVDDAVDRDEAAAAVGIGRPLAAFHLDRLVVAGLLDVEYRRRSGRSDPQASAPVLERCRLPSLATVIDRPPAQGPAPSAMPQPRRGLYVGPLKITPAVVLVTVALIGSAAYVLYVVTQVEDQQIQLLGYGFAVLGASFAAIAIGALVSVWRAASRARTRRALVLAIVGGVAGLFAIGCFTFTALALLVGER